MLPLYITTKTYHDQVSGRGRQVVCRNEKWMSQKDHSILSLIRLNATYTHSHTRRYFFSYFLSITLSLSSSFFSYFFQAVYLSLTPPLTPCTEERRDANFFFFSSLSLSFSLSLYMKMLFDYPFSFSVSSVNIPPFFSLHIGVHHPPGVIRIG